MKKSKYLTKYPRVDAANFRAWNEEMFEKYNNERVYKHVNPIIRLIEKRRVRLLLEGLGNLNNDDEILAAGCGEGHIESKIKTGNLHLVDISREAIKRAREKPELAQTAKFYLEDLQNLPFKGRCFDYIECSEVIEHVLSPTELLDEFYRVLKNDGKLVITFPNEPLINYIKKVLIKLRVFNLFFPNVPTDMLEEWHLRSYDLKKFKKDSQKKWRIKSVSATPHVFFPIRYILVCQKN